MAKGYGQYCPLALAAEILGQRWTILVISRVIDGCATFNEIHRGVPGISPSMLSKRLAELEDAGIIVRRGSTNGRGATYEVTQAGRDLDPIIMAMAVWGQHWAREMTLEDLDPGFLAWSIHMRMHGGRMPPGRTVLEFDFTGAPEGTHRFWLVNEDGVIDMCLKHPGYETDVLVEADLRTFVECWRGIRDLRYEIESRRIRLTGPRELKRAFPDWLMLSALAPYERKRPGRERNLYRRNMRQAAPA